MKVFFQTIVALVLGIGYILAAHATPLEVGHVEIMQGEVIVHPLSGLSRQVGNGTQIYEGDTIETTDGAVVIRLTNDSVLEFYDYSKFTFQEYRNNGAKAKYELHQGAVTYTNLEQHAKIEGRDIKFKAGTSLVSPIGTGFRLNRGNVGGFPVAVVFVNFGQVNLQSYNKNATVNSGEWGIGTVKTETGGRKNGHISVGTDLNTVINDFAKKFGKKAEAKKSLVQLISNFVKRSDDSTSSHKNGKKQDNGEVVVTPGGGEKPASPN